MSLNASYDAKVHQAVAPAAESKITETKSALKATPAELMEILDTSKNIKRAFTKYEEENVGERWSYSNEFGDFIATYYGFDTTFMRNASIYSAIIGTKTRETLSMSKKAVYAMMRSSDWVKTSELANYIKLVNEELVDDLRQRALNARDTRFISWARSVLTHLSASTKWDKKDRVAYAFAQIIIRNYIRARESAGVSAVATPLIDAWIKLQESSAARFNIGDAIIRNHQRLIVCGIDGGVLTAKNKGGKAITSILAETLR